MGKTWPCVTARFITCNERPLQRPLPEILKTFAYSASEPSLETDADDAMWMLVAFSCTVEAFVVTSRPPARNLTLATWMELFK